MTENAGTDDLHRRAERILRDEPSADRGEPDADSARLVHELRVHQIELELQNEELRESRAVAEENHALYRDLYESAPVAYLSVDWAGAIGRANPAAITLFKQTPEELTGRSLLDFVQSAARPALLSFLAKISASERKEQLELSLNLSDGSSVYVRIMGIGKCDRSMDSLLAVIDMSDREALDKAGQENAMLMRELQHRVKNNLNVVSSLLALGEDEVEDPRALAVIRKSRARIMAMSLIYEQLYRTEKVRDIDLWTYLDQLIGPLLEAYSVDSSRFRLVKEFRCVRLDAQQAALAGLIFSELISNATKYAYLPGSSGEIRVSLLETEERIVLSVSDDGPGLPADFDWRKSESMGFTLLRMLSEQMRAELIVDSPRGSGLTVSLLIDPESAG